MNKIKKWMYRNRRYTCVKQDDLNILVETDASRARRAERREVFNMILSAISAIAAIIAAVFATLAYINA